MKVFSEYAQYYDLLNRQKDYEKEANYIGSLLKSFAPDAKELLDLGCGTGLHAVHFAEKGYTITGIDQSKEMIAIANERIQKYPKSISDSVKYLSTDVRSFSINKKFDAVVSLFHVVSYQVSNEGINNTFNTVSNHLKSGGTFIFDCWYGPAVLSDKPHKRVKQIENDKILVSRQAMPKMHPSKNQVDVHYTIEILNKESGQKKQFEEIHKMRYLFNPEIELFLKNNDLQLLRSEEWISGTEPNFNSWYVTFICQKK